MFAMLFSLNGCLKTLLTAEKGGSSLKVLKVFLLFIFLLILCFAAIASRDELKKMYFLKLMDSLVAVCVTFETASKS